MYSTGAKKLPWKMRTPKISWDMNCKDVTKSHYTAQDWAEESECDPMQKSKKLSEKAAWKFINELPKD